MSLDLSKISHNFLHKPADKVVSSLSSGEIAAKTKRALGDVFCSIAGGIEKKAPSSIAVSGGNKVPVYDSFPKKLKEACIDFVEMPFDIIDEFAQKHPSSGLNNLGFLQKYRERSLRENEIKAFQGAFDDTSKFIKEKGGKLSNKELAEKFDKLLDDSMEFNKATYDTKKERFITRIVSGFTAAAFLGADFYNSAKLKGKSDDEAKKAQGKKQAQEIKENLMEGMLGYGVAACVSKFVNANLWASVLVNTGISFLARIVSRKMSGMPLTRVKVPENSMNEFMKAAKNHNEYKTQSEKDKEAKKPVLSLKNIGLLCGAVVAAGFSIKALKSCNIFGDKFNEKIKQLSIEKNKKYTEQVTASKGEIKQITKILKNCGEAEYASRIKKHYNKGDSFKLGTKPRTVKLFNRVEVNLKDLHELPLAPFKMVYNIVSYPYKKIAEPLWNSFRKVEHAPKDTPYSIKNLYIRFKEYEAKYGSDPEKLNEEFGKYVKKLRLASLNNATVSKVDNSKIGIMAQTTGTLAGMWFNMNDEFNASVKNGESKQDAEKAARKRGLNKFARMTSQTAISGTLNSLFKRQYVGSLFGAGLIVAASTVITDMVSRLLTAMPTRKMKSKEELERYQENSKNGAMAWYHNGIDKLAS